MDKIIFDVNKCREAKEILGKIPSARKIWGKEFSPSRSIGKCSMLYKILQPTSYEDFYYKYIKYAENHHNETIPNRGLTEKEIIELAWRYKNLSEENADYEQPLYRYADDAICHIIIETYDGMKRERDALAIARSYDPNIQPANYKYDSEYGMDMLSVKNNTLNYGIQIKPISFFKSKSEDVNTDRKILCEKYIKAQEDLKIKTYYMIYETNNGNISWKKMEINSYGNLMMSWIMTENKPL